MCITLIYTTYYLSCPSSLARLLSLSHTLSACIHVRVVNKCTPSYMSNDKAKPHWHNATVICYTFRLLGLVFGCIDRAALAATFSLHACIVVSSAAPASIEIYRRRRRLAIVIDLIGQCTCPCTYNLCLCHAINTNNGAHQRQIMEKATTRATSRRPSRSVDYWTFLRTLAIVVAPTHAELLLYTYLSLSLCPITGTCMLHKSLAS
jgi:hypothetical protein